MTAIVTFAREQLWQPLVTLPPSARFQCVVIGILGGVAPIPAVTTFITVLLCKLMAFAAAQTAVATAINVALTPVQIVMLPYFADAGALLVGAVLLRGVVAPIIARSSPLVVGSLLLPLAPSLAATFADRASSLLELVVAAADALTGGGDGAVARRPSQQLADALVTGDMLHVVRSAGWIVAMAVVPWLVLVAVMIAVMKLLAR